MSVKQEKRMLAYVAFGLQSGGSTMVSYCFLQRDDMTGVLDWFHDRLPEPPNEPVLSAWWCKCTIACFRAVEVIAYLENIGWEVQPILIVRDVRHAMDSLVTRAYGRNATTAEDPPLRIRFRRFLADWEHFRENGLPILRFEDFTSDPEAELQRACAAMGLPWEESMVSWPKPRGTVWKGGGANQNFVDSIGDGLHATMREDRLAPQIRNLPKGELAWLDSVFHAYNKANGYPLTSDDFTMAACPEGDLEPALINASRYSRMRRNGLIHSLLPSVGWLRRRLAGRRP